MAKSEETGPKASASWEEHGERVRAAVAMSARMFIRANEQRIAKSSSEDAAKNSYVSGMIDMLSASRNVIGFWGADQILMELERLNRKSVSPGIYGKRPDTGSGERPKRTTSDSGELSGKKVTSPGELGQKAGKSVDRDPMFA